MEKLIERVKLSERTKATWRSNSSTIEWKEASQLNKTLTGVPLNSAAKCECIEDLFFLLKRENVNEKIKNKMAKKFLLKKGKLIMSADHSNVGEQSSDEDMMKALKRSPGLIKFFAIFPENWKELCGIEDEEADDSEKEEEIDSNSYEERKALLMPFWEFLKEDHKSVDFGSLPEDSFEIILKEAEESFLEAQERDLNEGSSDEKEEEKEEVNEEKEEDKTPEAQVSLTASELDKLKVSQLRQLLIDKNVEIPQNISRKPDIIEFILEKL